MAMANPDLATLLACCHPSVNLVLVLSRVRSQREKDSPPCSEDILAVIRSNALNTFPGMNQIEIIVLHRGGASASTRSLMYQCKALSLTTSTFRPRRSSRSCMGHMIHQARPWLSTRMSRSLGPAHACTRRGTCRKSRSWANLWSEHRWQHDHLVMLSHSLLGYE
jgi:hypothetical protein